MGIDFPSSLTASIGQKFTYSGQEYEFNGTAWRKVKDRVTSFNGATGAIIGVTSVQGKTGDVTLTDLEITHGVETFNGLSGSVEGVSSFNGLTGSVDTSSLTLQIAGVTLGAGGITFSDGTQLTSEGQIAFKNEANNFTQNNTFTTTKGLGSNGDAEVALKFTDNYIVDIGDPDGDSSGWFAQVNGTSETFKIEGQGGVEYNFDVNTFDAKSNLIKTTSNVQSSGISLDNAGITFADGTFQKTAAKSGYRYVIDQVGSGALSSTPSAGTIDVTQQFVGLIDKISIHDTDADGNDISSLLSIFADAGGYLQVMTADNLELFVAHISPADLADTAFTHTFSSDVFVLQHNSDGIEMIGLDTFESGDEVFVTIVPASNAVVGITDSTRGTSNAIAEYVYLDGSPVNSGGLSAGHHSNFNRLFIDDEVKLNLKGVTLGTGHLGFNDGTVQQTATKGVATFTMKSSSALATGQKIEAMYRMPYDATLLRLDGKLSSSSGLLRGSIDIAGPDFGDPTASHTQAVGFQNDGGSGITFDFTSFDTASITAGNFLYVDVAVNGAGATGAQLFLTYETRA